jgi:hypothetical protein
MAVAVTNIAASSVAPALGLLVAMLRATTNVAVTRQLGHILPVAVPRSGLVPSYTERRPGLLAEVGEK